jgi:nicotinamide-nucleotide amidase
MDAELLKLADQLAHTLKVAGLSLTTAESCTGGGLAQVLTAIPGSSLWFERGFVSYSNLSKHEMLGVGADVLAQHGAVSEPVARAMVEGALRHSHADLAVAITGIAGPGGGTEEKPVGTVCFSWAGRKQETRSTTLHFPGDRAAVRGQAMAAAMEGLQGYLREYSK